MRAASTLSGLCVDGFGPEVVVACGVFDGVHLGHRQIIAALMAVAAETGAAPAVLTFDPHPRTILRPGLALQLLTSPAHKLRLLAGLGVRGTVMLPFTRALADLPPADFLDRYLLATGVQVRAICVGSAWRFGRRGMGDTALLAAAGARHGFRVMCVPEFRLHGSAVSSTRIRSAIANGELGFAGELLGRPYSVYGTVVAGRGLGRSELACPTANISDPGLLLPPSGVYAVRVTVDGEPAVFAGIAYVGTAPTVNRDGGEDSPRLLEVHLFEYAGSDLYGRGAEVEFVSFVRADRTFPSLAALRRQIDADIRQVRATLAGTTEGGG